MSWTLVGNIQGPVGSTGATGSAGADGKTVRSGGGAPSGGLGVDGDFYIDTAANTIYGPKTSGAWGSPTSLVGPTGATGSTGATGPAGADGPQGTQSANVVYAGPTSGSAATPTFRALVAADIPDTVNYWNVGGDLHVTGASLFDGAVTSSNVVEGTNITSGGNTTGNSASATQLLNARNIDGQSFNGTANITVIAPGTNAAASKATPIDADALPLVDSAASNALKKLTWVNLKATLKTYFDGLYPSGSGTSTGTNTGDQTSVSGNAGTATVLATPRAINGVNFDGSAAITVTAAAGTLSGATLAAGVTASSLTSFGASPTLVTPVLGAATGTSISLSQGLNVTGNGAFVNAANKFGLDVNGGTTRFYASGPDGTTPGNYEFHVIASDGTPDDVALVIDSLRNVGVGSAAPGRKFVVDAGANNSYLQVTNSTVGSTASNGLEVFCGTSGLAAIINRENAALQFHTNDTNRVEITATGQVGIGTSTPLDVSGYTYATISNATNGCGYTLYNNNTRTASFNMSVSDSSASIGTEASSDFTVYTNATTRVRVGSTTGHITPGADNTQNFGSGALRWKEIFAGTAIINTSDAREKTPVTPMTDSEITAATQLAREIGSYQWLAAVKDKGASKARQHVGLTVQRAIQVMTANGLDPFKYGFICYDKWDEQVTETLEQVDEEGHVIAPATRTVIPAGDRYGFRNDEMLLFLARGFDARLAALEKKAKL